MSHSHDIDGMLGDASRFSARHLRLHLDNSHDARTSGWDFARLDELHHQLHAPRPAVCSHLHACCDETGLHAHRHAPSTCPECARLGGLAAAARDLIDRLAAAQTESEAS
jgi:hypothetical protein